MPPTYVTAYRPADSPVVVDDQGRTLEGRGWDAVRRSQLLDELANRGDLIVVTGIEDTDSFDAPARAAARKVDALNAIADQWANVPIDTIRQAAADVARMPPPDGMDRAALVDLLARADVTPPTKSRPRAAATQED